MTTIAYRDGVLATDSFMTGGSPPFVFASVDKTATNFKGDIASTAGDYRAYPKFLSWVTEGSLGSPPSSPDFNAEGLLIRFDGGMFIWPGTDTLIELPRDTKFMALGSGERFAMGAMFAGATAEEAVRAGIEFDSGSGGAIKILKLGECA